MTAQIDTTLSDAFKTTSLGDPRTAIGEAFYNVSHRQANGNLPANNDQNGLVFFTRPQLNLTPSNVSNDRRLVPLLTEESVSVQRMVRKALDPRCTEACPVFNDRSAFIPVLSNLLTSLNGWPDPSLESYTSKPGMAGEEISFVDGYIDNKSVYTLNATFHNVVGSPITFMMDSWLIYMDGVFEGGLLPYPDFIAAKEIDYMTRIYRLVLDKTNRFVQRIAACGAAYPISSTSGQDFNYDTDKPRIDANDSQQIQFKANGWIYNDYILIKHFNNVVGVFNPDMRKGNLSNMVKLLPGELIYFKNRGYPRIDPDTLELQWWVSPGEYDAKLAALTRHSQAIGYSLPNLQID